MPLPHYPSIHTEHWDENNYDFAIPIKINSDLNESGFANISESITLVINHILNIFMYKSVLDAMMEIEEIPVSKISTWKTIDPYTQTYKLKYGEIKIVLSRYCEIKFNIINAIRDKKLESILD